MRYVYTFLWLILGMTASAETKFASVRVKEIYRELPSTKKIYAELADRKESLESHERLVAVRKSIKSLEELRTELQRQLEESRTSDKQELADELKSEFDRKWNETESLRTEWEKFKAEQQREFAAEAVKKMRIVFERISEAASQVAKERNFDAVIEVSGESNTGLPFVIYSEGAEDITADVFAFLNEKEKIEDDGSDQSQEGETPED